MKKHNAKNPLTRCAIIMDFAREKNRESQKELHPRYLKVEILKKISLPLKGGLKNASR